MPDADTITLLAQNGPPAIPELPPWQEWWHYGPLGILALLVCAAVVLVLSAIGAWLWVVQIPHWREQKRIEREKSAREAKLELDAKEKALALSDTLRETMPVMASTQRRLVEVAERMEDRQGPHAEECKRTLAKVEVLTERVDSIAGHLRIGPA